MMYNNKTVDVFFKLLNERKKIIWWEKKYKLSVLLKSYSVHMCVRVALCRKKREKIQLKLNLLVFL